MLEKRSASTEKRHRTLSSASFKLVFGLHAALPIGRVSSELLLQHKSPHRDEFHLYVLGIPRRYCIEFLQNLVYFPLETDDMPIWAVISK